MSIPQVLKILEYIRQQTDVIRGDWTDPRHNCREIWEAVDRAKELLGTPLKSPYRNRDNESKDQYLKRIANSILEKDLDK